MRCSVIGVKPWRAMGDKEETGKGATKHHGALDTLFTVKDDTATAILILKGENAEAFFGVSEEDFKTKKEAREKVEHIVQSFYWTSPFDVLIICSFIPEIISLFPRPFNMTKA